MKAFKYILVVVLILSITMPAMAGNGPGGPGGGGGKGGGGKPTIPDTGTLYGDLYVILRDENGVPIFDANGCLQPISAVDGPKLEIYDSTNTVKLFETTPIAGEPFSLAFYTDAAAELEVECELTPEMADWVMTVDFGRLNMGRAPAHVIAHGFDEAVNKMNVATEIALDPAGRLVLTFEDGSVKTIDAPKENLALYIEMMTDGDWITEDTTPIVMGQPPTDVGPPEGDGPSTEPRPVLNGTAIAHLEELGFTNLGDDQDADVAIPVPADDSLNNDELLLAASLLAAAADKTGSITLDKDVYINFIYGINQLGTLSDGEPDGSRTYFDFSDFTYGRSDIFSSRSSGGCGPGWIYVLQPEADTDNDPSTLHYITTCMDLLGYDPDTAPTYNAVRFTNMAEVYYNAYGPDGSPLYNSTDVNGADILMYGFNSNVRGFTQAADDALQVLEYIHNYKVPEVLYP